MDALFYTFKSTHAGCKAGHKMAKQIQKKEKKAEEAFAKGQYKQGEYTSLYESDGNSLAIVQ